MRRRLNGTSQSAPWHSYFANTPLKCHALGILSVIALLWLNIWIVTHPEMLCSDPAHTDQEIADAIELVSSRNLLSNQFTCAMQEHERQQQSIESISQWLPESRDWADVRATLQSIAAQSGVQLIGFDRGEKHFGTRVAVMESQCAIDGRYLDICRFIEQLSSSSTPVWCGEIRIRRNQDPSERNVSSGTLEDASCQAELTIRIPFAGQGTTAEKLMKRRINHANNT